MTFVRSKVFKNMYFFKKFLYCVFFYKRMKDR